MKDEPTIYGSPFTKVPAVTVSATVHVIACLVMLVGMIYHAAIVRDERLFGSGVELKVNTPGFSVVTVAMRCAAPTVLSPELPLVLALVRAVIRLPYPDGPAVIFQKPVYGVATSAISK